MDRLLKQVENARLRMIGIALLGRLCGWLSATLAVAAVAIATPKLVAIEGLPEQWAAGWLIGAVVIAAAGAAIVTWRRHSSQLDAAVEIDRRFDLRERVASSLSLPESERDSAIGQALILDAAKRVERIDVRQEFPVRLSRGALLPLAPATVAAALMLLVADQRAAEATAQPPAAAEQVKKSINELRKKIAERVRKNQEDQDLQDANGVLKEVQKGLEEVAAREDSDRKDTTVKLNDLTKQLDKRRQELGGSEAVKKALEKLNGVGRGPAEKAAKALQQGDWGKALKQLEELGKKLASGELSAEDRKKLSEQIGKLKERLDAAREAQQQKAEQLQKQIEEQRRQGNLAEASRLQQKLDQIQQQQQQSQQLEQLADQLGQAQQALAEGDQQAASEAFNQLAGQLQQMQQEIDQMEVLDEALDQIEQAKDAMNCQQCQGGGCQACQGQGFGEGQGQGKGNGNGQGLGEGQGSGPRPDEENATSLRDTRVRQNPQRGDSTFGGRVNGPNTRGDVQQSLKESLIAPETAEAEALDEQRLPRSRREHARQYFERLREEL